ncbi:heterokaryon incompatibility protein-domain-containing protein [Pestalotiopsis sp. NC0098]|nr:heterokaryon incompatibility protein-domain-containing protein [Pestalotiopsis sp. NC0098]
MSLYENLGGQLRGDQIRLLTLTQAPDGDNVEPQIRCDLEVAQLGDIESTPPEYFALSYTWGRPAEYGKFKAMTDEKKFPVLCNGEYTIWVTENLLAFFRRIQQKTPLKSKRLWIDAICINQDNNNEKAAQISLMTRIYSRAKTVLLWLGEDDEYTASGFGLIEELSSHRILPETANVNESLAVGMVFQRTYFSRTWVIQEVILGTDDSGEVMVMCGSFSIDWQVLVDASHHITKTSWMRTLDQLVAQNHAPGEPSPLRRSSYGFPTILRAISADRSRGASTWTRTLLHALIRARDFRATQLEDKVYSLLGLVQEHIQDKTHLSPTYGGISATYINAAIAILKESRGDLLLLSCVEGERFQPTKGLPSWVPDWSCDSPLGLRRTGYERYWASADLTQQPEIDIERLTLTLKGIKIDEVTVVGEAKHEVANASQQFPRWPEILASLPETYPTSSLTEGAVESRFEAFWRTLLCNTSGEKGEITPRDSPLGASFARWLQGRAEKSREVADLLSDDWFSSASSLESGNHGQAEDFGTLFNHSRHLRLFRTGSGYLGLGTECMEVHDSIWILPGSRIPLILRSVEGDKDNQYRLVGGAYLHGFMHGEVIAPEIRPVLETIVIE